jgi:prepilin-type N-terminal cleavage/methylation domain-containing protein
LLLLKRQSPGFTLIEILLALGIFSMLIAALYSTWALVTRATIVGKTTAAQMQRERIAMRSIEDSLTCIQSHQASIDYYLFDVQNGDQPTLSFTAYLPDSFPRSGEFMGNTPDGSSYMDYHLRRLTFSLEPGEGGGSAKNLVLRQNPVMMDLSTEEQNTPLVLARNVSDFLIECWDTNTMQWDTEWDATNIIPPLVRVTLAFGSQNSGGSQVAGGTQVITREISFPSTTMPSMVQVPNNNANYTGGRNLANQNSGGNNPGMGSGP